MFSYRNTSIFSFFGFEFPEVSKYADSGRVNIFVPIEKILIGMGGVEVRHVLGNKNIGGSQFKCQHIFLIGMAQNFYDN